MYEKSNVKDIYSLSPMQEGMLFHHILDPKTTASFIQEVFTLEGEVDLKLLKDSFNFLIRRYDILRTFFSYHKTKKPRQIVLKEWQIRIYFKDISRLNREEQPDYMENLKKSDRERGFDLLKEIPLRISVIKTADSTCKLVWSSHHILMDGWCMEILLSDFIRVYQAFRDNTSPGLEPVMPYSRYIHWLEKQDKAVALEYWRDYLAGCEKSTGLPKFAISQEKDREKDNAKEYGIILQEEALVKGIKGLLKKNRVTTNTLFQVLWGILLQKYNNTKEVVFGTIISSRPPDLDRIELMVGLFVNLVPKRIILHEGETLSPLLRRIQRESALFQPFEFVPAADIQALTPLKHRLIDHILVFENYPTHDQLVQSTGNNRLGFKITGTESFLKTEYDLNVLVHEEQGIQISFIFTPHVYGSEFIEKVSRQLLYITEQAAKNHEIEIKDISLLREEEKQEILMDFNRTGGEYPANKTIHCLFEEQAGRTPRHTALISSRETHENHLTYKELNKAANRLAGFLQRRGIGPGQTAAVILEDPLEMVIGLIGVLKSGAAYLPISPGHPGQRMITMLKDSAASIIITSDTLIKKRSFKFTSFRGFEDSHMGIQPVKTSPRAQVEDLDSLQIPDRSLIDYEKYVPYIGQAMVKNSIILQFSRGCVYNCAYCFKIRTKGYVCRSAENIFAEIRLYYKMGIRRFGFVDDLPNFNVKESSKLFRLIIDNGLNVQLHFPNGIRGDILTKDYIDLMVEAGTVTMDLALETASPRLQRLIRKNLNIQRLRENLEYIIQKYPQVLLECQILHGIPTETCEEAEASLEFIKSLKWVHFPYMHILKIYPDTEMARIAMENGTSKEAINRSTHLGYHELPETLPFEKSFTRAYQSRFVNEYFLSKNRLLHVLPHQMKVLTEDELVQKYNSYLPVEIKTFTRFLDYVGIDPDRLGTGFLPENYGMVPGINKKIAAHFSRTPGKKTGKNPLRVMLLDLSRYFTHESRMIYDVMEPPLGLMYLAAYLKKTFGNKVICKIAKSGIDFNSYEELKSIIFDFEPQVIGVRSLNFYKDFFHKTIALVRHWGIKVPIIAGGPYATASWQTMLKDKNIDLAVLGEGELTLGDIIALLMHNKKWPDEQTLETIPGIAYIREKDKPRQQRLNREVLLVDHMKQSLAQEPAENPLNSIGSAAANLAYVIYTSGSSGNPKGVMVRHNSLVNQVTGLAKQFAPSPPASTGLSCILLADFTFDVSLMHIFLPLTTGAKLYLPTQQIKKDPERLLQFLGKKRINLLNIVPAYLQVLLKNLRDRQNKPELKYLFIGGEVFEKALYNQTKDVFKDSLTEIINIYGPTECTINATLYRDQGIEAAETVPIGKPLMNYYIYILDTDLNIAPIGAPGELCISGQGLAQGYLNQPELTAERFCPRRPGGALFEKTAPPGPPRKNFSLEKAPGKSNRSYKSYRSYITYQSYIYHTGDLARWLKSGDIEFLGRIDHQVKIRGFRIELGEIESLLTRHPAVKHSVVIVRQDASHDNYLCAYLVPANKNIDTAELKEYLAKQLPDYMVPPHFVQIEHLPVTPGGKIDRKSLPAPGAKANGKYAPPRDETEETMAQLWSEVIGMNKEEIGIGMNFFDLGGHSLKATILVSKIHRAFDIKISLSQIFKTPNIRQLSAYIRNAQKEKFQGIQPAEEREYYPLSPAQRRLYIVNQAEEQNILYNMPTAVEVEGDLNKNRLEQSFKGLIARHESIRTSLEIVNNEPVQRVHRELDFEIEYHYSLIIPVKVKADDDEGTRGLAPLPEEPYLSSVICHLSSDFIRPFELTRPPLMRARLIQLAEKKYILMVDMHHIIADGISTEILIREFTVLYQGPPLPPLRLRYKDYSQWLNTREVKASLKQQETYWLKQFAGSPPVLDLPTDYPRPGTRSFEGDQQVKEIDKELTAKIKQMVSDTNTTLYMLMLAVHYILLSKYTGQQDIVVGSGTAGRSHADLENIVGMFVNVLAIRNQPQENKTFIQFLNKVKENTLMAFHNQDYQFEELVKQLDLHRDSSRNPLFDTVFQVNDLELPEVEIPGLKLTPSENQEKLVRFDLALYAQEIRDTIHITAAYSTCLFKPSTIEHIVKNYIEILHQVIKNHDILIKEIAIHIPSALQEAETDIYQVEQSDFCF